MKQNDPIDREIEESLKRMSKMQKAALYIELLFRLAIYRLSQTLRYFRPRARAHWIGSHARPRRLERAFFIVVMFVAMITFEPHEYIAWAIAWGGGVSLFVIIQTLYKLAHRLTGSNHGYYS